MMRTLFVGLFFMSAAPAEAGTAAFDRAMAPILKQYLAIQKVLADDRTDGAAAAAEKIAKLAEKLDASTVTGEHAAHYSGIPAKLEKAARALAAAGDLAAARGAFKELSKPMAMWGTMSKPTRISVVYCSMAKGSWLQPEGGIRNPYHGKSMLTCGEIVGGAGAR